MGHDVLLSVTEWYFALETDGPDHQKNKILTIQYQRLEGGEPTGPFQVLAEWEWGEKQIVRSIVEKGILEPTDEFQPVGMGLRFHISFLIEKAEGHGVKKFTVEELRSYWLLKPLLELSAVPPIPEGATGGEAQGATVPTLYLNGQYTEIIEFVTQQKDRTLAFLRATRTALRTVPAARSGGA